MRIESLGNRICIIGLSNTGKSTLAVKLSALTGIPVYHLDCVAFEAGTNYRRRPDPEVIRDHDKIIQGESWIIDGRYGFCMPQRLRRATGVIWLDPSVPGSVYRYLRRCFKNDKNRPGRLEGATREFDLGLLRYIMFDYSANRKECAALTDGLAIPVLKIKSMRELRKLYAEYGL